MIVLSPLLFFLSLLSCSGFSEKRGLLWHEDGDPSFAVGSLSPTPCTTECVNAWRVKGGSIERTLRRSS